MKGLIFTYAMAYGGSVVALFNPFAGLLIYVCFSIIKPESLWHWSVPQGNYSRTVAIALLVGWALKGFGDWRFGRSTAVVGTLLGYLAWAAISATQAANQAVAWSFIENASKIILPFLVGITTINSLRKVKQLAWAIMLSMGYLAYDLNNSYYDGFNRLQFSGFGGMDSNSVAIALVTCVGFAFFLGLDARRWWVKAIVFGSAGLLINAVFFSFSRGAMLGLVVACLASFLLVPKRPAHFGLFVVFVLLGLRLAGPEVVQEFASAFVEEEERDASAQSRVELWAACWDVMQKQPVLGVGPDHWKLVAHEYGFPRGKEAHMTWLQIGAELGFPGLFLLVAFYGSAVIYVWPMTKDSTAVPGPWFRVGARMVIASLAGFGVSACFVSLEGLEVPYYIVLVGAGLLRLGSDPQAMRRVEGHSMDAATPYPVG